MKTPRHKLPAKNALLSSTAASMLSNVAPEANVGDEGDDGEQLVRTSTAAHKLDVSENTVREYMRKGLLERVELGSRTVRVTRASLLKLMGQQAAE